MKHKLEMNAGVVGSQRAPAQAASVRPILATDEGEQALARFNAMEKNP